MKDIPNYERFVKIAPIANGLSGDKKYFVKTADGQRIFLRLSDIKEFDRKKVEYEMMERVYALGVLAAQPLGFGLCDGGKSCYTLSGWLDSENVETALPHMSENEQYDVGMKTGVLLRKIHTLSAPDNSEPWNIRLMQKIYKRIDLYNKHNLKSENGEKIIKYLRDRQDLLKNRRQTFWHGDFNTTNHIIMRDGEVGIVDFTYTGLGYGDPWWEFVNIFWGNEPSAHYITGMINGYFNNVLPCDFFELLSYYFAYDALSALCSTFLGQEVHPPEDGRRHMANVLRWFDDMKNPIPTWYKINPV